MAEPAREDGVLRGLVAQVRAGGGDFGDGDRRRGVVGPFALFPGAAPDHGDLELGAAVVTREPLQPFDAANFIAPQPFSFDRQAYAAAEAARRGAQPAPSFVPAALAPFPEDEETIDDLVDFLTDPSKALLRQRLGVSFPRDPDEVADALPLSVTGLPRWHIGERYCSRRCRPTRG